MPNQNHEPNPDVTTPETGKAPERRKLLRNIVAVGAAGLAGLLLQGDANLVQPVKATCVTGCVHYKDSAKTVEVVTGTASYTGCCAIQSGVLGQACGKPLSLFDVVGVWGCAPNGIGVYGRSSGQGAIVAQPEGDAPGLWVFSESKSSVGIQVCAYECQSVPIQKWNSSELTSCSISSVVDQKGRFGIGTTSPGAPLDVVGADTSPLASGIRVSTLTYPQLLLNVLGGGSNEKIWRLIGRNANPSNAFQIETLDDTYATETVAMQITRSGTSISNVVFPNGYVGIGTSAPLNPLDVVGAMAVGTYAGVNTAPSNGLIVSGSVGIGTATPEAPLTVVSGTSITAALIGSSQGNLIFAKSGTNGFSMYSNAANYLGFYSNDSGLQPLTMNGSGVAVGNAYRSTAPPTNGAIVEGSVGIGTSAPTQTLSVNGTAGKTGGGSWCTFSDRRWKNPDSFRPFTEGLAWVRSLPPPMRFRYAEGNGIGADPAKEHVNFVAQCLLDGVHGSLVSEIQAKVKTNDKAPTTTYAVNVSDMQFAMLNAIKELAEENKAIREEIRKLQNRSSWLRRFLHRPAPS